MTPTAENVTVTVPFQIGQALWAPRTSSEVVTRPCPVCSGERIVTVIIGRDERVSVDCDACGIGYNRARGAIEEWDFTPHAEPFVIAAVDAFYNDKWRVRSAAGAVADFDVLCATEAEALAVSVMRCAEQHERNMQSRQHKRSGVQRATWTVQYHRKCITDLERQIEWHRARITAKKAAMPTVDT